MEEWKDIVGYEDYKISSLGRVKILKLGKERILKLNITTNGYYNVTLYKDREQKSKEIHQLVAIAFHNHTPNGFELVVNHIDFDKLNNHKDNLEIVTTRENSNRKHLKSSSKYVGVSWSKTNKKWISRIKINGKLKYLGYFTKEIEASNAYQKALNNSNK